MAQTENLNIQAIGRDPNPGSTRDFHAREAGAPSEDDDALPGIAATGPISNLSVGPHPFTTTTRVACNLERAASVDVTLYDAQGREVRRFVQNAVQPGRGAVSRDGPAIGVPSSDPTLCVIVREGSI